MGLNLNLTELLGLPGEAVCPKCRSKTPTRFDDYDIECGNPFPKPGRVSLHLCCSACEHEWRCEGTLTFEEDGEDLGAAL